LTGTSFWKMHGQSNDYIFINDTEVRLKEEGPVGVAVKLYA